MTDTLTKATAQANSDMPLISCVIIFLNGERYLAEAIESIRAQTHTNWELILVDDGSTDGATGIAKDYAARYPDQIRYTEHPNHENRGMSASRNAGIALARGEYVALLDADDIWLPHRLARHLQALAPHPEVALSISPSLPEISTQSPGRMVPSNRRISPPTKFLSTSCRAKPAPMDRPPVIAAMVVVSSCKVWNTTSSPRPINT